MTRDILRDALLVAAMTVHTLSPAAAQEGYGATTSGFRVKLAQVVDTRGGAQPIAAYTVMMPHHWIDQGGIVASGGEGCSGLPWETYWAASSPDNRYAAVILPARSWTFSPIGQPTNSSCPNVQVRSARDYLAWQASQLAGSFSVLAYRDRPDLLAELGLRPGPEPYTPGWPERGTQLIFDAGELHISYSQQGTAYEAILSTAVIMFNSQLLDRGTSIFNLFGGSPYLVFLSAAPAGQLDLRFSEFMRKSVAMTPQWARALAEHNARRHAAAMAATQAEHRARMQAQYEATQSIQDAYARRTETSDRTHRETMEQVRGVETYDDPVTGTPVQLDRLYSTAWRLDDGSYHVTNDGGFDPMAVFGIPGTRMQLTQ